MLATSGTPRRSIQRYVRTRAGERVTAAQLLKQPDVRIKSLVDSGAVTLETDRSDRGPRPCQRRDDREVRGLSQASDGACRALEEERATTNSERVSVFQGAGPLDGGRRSTVPGSTGDARTGLTNPRHHARSHRRPRRFSRQVGPASLRRRTSEQSRVSGSPLEARTDERESRCRQRLGRSSRSTTDCWPRGTRR